MHVSQWNFDAEELLVLAREDLKKGVLDQGLSKLKQGAQQTDCPIELHLDLARVYAQIGLRRKAKQHFQRYLLEKPDDVDATFQSGMIDFEEGQTDAALESWSRVLGRVSAYPPALFFTALATARKGNAPAAIGMLKSAMESIPVDNLYFGRSRELLTSLEAGKPADDHGRPH